MFTLFAIAITLAFALLFAPLGARTFLSALSVKPAKIAEVAYGFRKRSCLRRQIHASTLRASASARELFPPPMCASPSTCIFPSAFALESCNPTDPPDLANQLLFAAA